MKYALSLSFFLAFGFGGHAQKRDTIHVRPADLNIKGLQLGDYSYLITRQKAKDSPAMSLIIAKMSVERSIYHNKAAIVVRQRWERDSVVHRAYTVFDASDFSTLLHDSYWRALGYSLVFDFETRKFSSEAVVKAIPDSVKESCEKELAGSFEKYNLNWHDDLVIYSMLHYREGRTFMINYYDPGFGTPMEVAYTVTGSDFLTGRGGDKIECWMLEHGDENGTEKFWISKKALEVLKEEDRGAKGGYRYKYKLGVDVVKNR